MATEKRLIDKWAVIKLLRGKWMAKYPVSFYFGLIAAADEIEKLPAEDAVEVVHGRWIPVCDNPIVNKFYCSVCRIPSMKGNYCPNCGADMRERKDNG